MHAPASRPGSSAIAGGVGTALVHDSGAKHVSGEAVYVDDIPEPPGMLHIYIAMSERAHAAIETLDVSKVRAAPGVAVVLTAKDVPGVNDVSPVAGDDPMFADGLVEYWGQSLFAVAAETVAQARAAARLAVVEYEERPAVKVAQVVAEELQVDIGRIKITATTTAKVPNTSPTAASSGSDLNGMAARNAAAAIKARLARFLAERHQADVGEVRFLPNRIRIREREVPFDQAIGEAHRARVHLSAAGFYATPKIQWDRAANRGRPFFYFAYGAAVSEVAIDTLTGENRIVRADILHDVGRSLNPAIDLGQVEGGFVQGAGWLTMEELVWDEKGRLMTHAPSTYKIPACSDRSIDLNMKLWDKGRNAEETVYRSKAVGEPPLMLGISVLMALSDAVASVGGYRIYPALDAPATPERILTAVERIKRQAGAATGAPAATSASWG
jgi:xanthine dehydrogenase molybdopterin-binding subunit B